ncbi:MAG: thioredoxin family protein [Bdellovibrionaceae bacterium]|nr:thioredoxin family protein [Pseudobdellovibrionaceae bacterium]
MRIGLLILSFFYQFSSAQIIGKSLQSARIEKTKDGFSLKVIPNKEHHYNLDAPTSVTKNGQKQTLTSLTPSQLILPVATDGKCDYVIHTYVCDDKKTFCAPQKMTLSCEDLKKLSTRPEFSRQGSIDVSASLNEKNDKAEPMADDKKSGAINSAKKKEIFIVNDPKMAFDLAKKTGKPLFIDFFGAWCPPCNTLDETVFNTPGFVQTAKGMVLLKLDADDKISWDLKSKYTIGGYPTVVLATAHGEEITRFVGTLPQSQIVKMMNYAIQNKHFSLAQKMEQYEKKASPKIALEIIESLVASEKYAETLPYIPEAFKQAKLTLSEKEMLLLMPILVLSKIKSDDVPKSILPIAKNLFASYPVSDLYFPKQEMMKALAESMKDDALKKWVLETQIKNVHTALANTKWELNTLTRVDLMHLRASAHEELGQTEEFKKDHAEIATEYAHLINLYKQNPQTNRGYNLERIHSLYKSGSVEEARQEYEKIITIYPHEFAFHYNYANVLKGLKNWDEALKYAQNSLTYSYGDNQLRSIYLISELEYRKGLKKEPIERLTKAIETTELPKDETVRTHRYVKRLVDLKKIIQEGKTIK